MATGLHGAVLGIDPGSRQMGWAVVIPNASGSLRRVDSGCIRLGARDPLPQRLGVLFGELQQLFDRHTCTALAIESAFMHENAHTALVLGQARGLPVALAASRGLEVHEYAPALVKRRITGSGKAEKGQMREMVRVILGLDSLPGEDEADALAVAVAHLRAVEWAGRVPAVAPAAAVLLAASQAKEATSGAKAQWLALLAARGRR